MFLIVLNFKSLKQLGLYQTKSTILSLVLLHWGWNLRVCTQCQICVCKLNFFKIEFVQAFLVMFHPPIWEHPTKLSQKSPLYSIKLYSKIFIIWRRHPFPCSCILWGLSQSFWVIASLDNGMNRAHAVLLKLHVRINFEKQHFFFLFQTKMCEMFLNVSFLQICSLRI